MYSTFLNNTFIDIKSIFHENIPDFIFDQQMQNIKNVLNNFDEMDEKFIRITFMRR